MKLMRYFIFTPKLVKTMVRAEQKYQCKRVQKHNYSYRIQALTSKLVSLCDTNLLVSGVLVVLQVIASPFYSSVRPSGIPSLFNCEDASTLPAGSIEDLPNTWSVTKIKSHENWKLTEYQPPEDE